MRGNRFTIYDALENKGYFDSNPANNYARDKTTGESIFAGPVEYPKALFHPEGEERIVVPAEVIVTPLGPKAVNELRELIYKIVQNSAEEAAAKAEGWHNHPAQAIRKRVEMFIEGSPSISEKEKAKLLASIPAVSSDSRIKELEKELARLTAMGTGQVEEAKAPAAAQPASGPLQPLASANALGAKFGGTHSPAASPLASPAASL